MIYSYRSETLYRIIPDKYILSQESIKKKEIFFSFTITIVTKMSLNKKEKKNWQYHVTNLDLSKAKYCSWLLQFLDEIFEI